MPQDYVILCLAAALGGAVNAIAGGGTLLTFPALFAALGSTGDAAVIANGTSTVALVPGSIAALAGYRQEIRAEGRWVVALIAPSLVGGVIGSLLVVMLPSEIFKVAVPWLILIAASLFALQPQISRLTGIGQPREGGGMPGIRIGSIAFQFVVAVYGGYFGAGIGILMLSALAMLGMTDIHRMNAVKTLLASLINGTSCVIFIASGDVNWPYAIAMSIASSVGGYLAAHAARRVDRRVVRAIVVGIGFVLAGYYFYRQAAG